MIENPIAVILIINQSVSISEMIDYLFNNIFKKINDYNMKLLIIDGNSTDGTSSIVKNKIKEFKDIDLIIEQKKEGIGAAYIKGFKYAVEKLNADVLIEFDGDFQHPPETIIELLKEISNGYDYVLGSRKIKGGSYPKNFGFKRNLFSKLGGFITRFMLFFPFKDFFKITDPTTGLKATRVDGFFDKMNLDDLKDKGFGYKIELLYKMTELNAKIKEIPLKFQIREKGQSKILNETPKEMLKLVFLLRFMDKKTRRFLKFGTVGFIGYIVNGFFTELFFSFHLTQVIADYFINYKNIIGLNLLYSKSAWASAIGVEISIISNYILNNLWTFSSQRINKFNKFIIKLLQFNFTSIGAVIIQFIFVGIITLIFGEFILIRQLSIIFSIVFLIIPYNWFMYNKIIWKKNNIIPQENARVRKRKL